MRAYKIRLLPTKEQEELMWKHIHACRFIWNWGLNIQIKAYEENGIKMTCFDTINLLTKLKKQEEFLWLNDVSRASLQNILRDLDKAYFNFFRGKGHPKFKSKKKSKPTYPVRQDGIYFQNQLVQIPKVGKLRYKTNYIVPQKGDKIYNPRISYINKKWILSFVINCDNQAKQLTDKNMGIDLGIKDFCIVAFDNKIITFPNINKQPKIKKMQRQIHRLERKASRKYRCHGNYEKTKNIIKTEARIKKLYYHISCIRKNYIHQITHTLVSLKPKSIIIEDLNVSGMMKNRHLAKAIQEQCFFEFRRQMQYKCEWNGIEFILADRFYPSSKTCSKCGNIKKDLKLSDRTYVCPKCGLVIDRDYNAAINLMKYAE